jgi:hypothetical protein
MSKLGQLQAVRAVGVAIVLGENIHYTYMYSAETHTRPLSRGVDAPDDGAAAAARRCDFCVEGCGHASRLTSLALITQHL